MAAGQAITVAVVTGGHSYDVPNFHNLFRSFDGMDIYIQHMDDFASSPAEVRRSYDAVVFYIMLLVGPTDEPGEWFAGKPKTALEDLGKTKQGIFILHHAILAYPDWPVWNQMVGIEDRKFDYYIGEKPSFEIADPGHAITQGLRPWTMIDETYAMADAGEGSHLLLTCQHPKSMKTIAWTRQHGQSRMFCYESGHDNEAWADVNFRQVVRRGIQWCAGRI